MKLNLQAKMVIGIVTLLASVCLAIGISTVINVRQQLSTAITEKAKSDAKTSLAIIDLVYPGPWINQNGVLYKGTVKINDNSEIVDRIASLTENTVTVFLYDTRVTTTIIQDGKRAVGTKAADNVIESVLKKEKNYLGEADVLGVTYRANYTPIKDANGQVIGMFYQGVSKQFADELENDFLLRFAGFVFVSLLLSSLVGWYLGRKIARPIVDMSRVAEQIAAGDFAVNVNLGIATRDEVGQLATTFNKMTSQLRMRDEALNESEKKYRSLLDNLNIGVYRNTGDPKAGFIQANPALVKMLGYDSNKEFMEVLPTQHYQDPEDRKRFIDDIKRDGSVKNREMAMRKRDGMLIWCSFSTAAQFDELGNIKFLDGVVEDITERKQAEERLKDANKQLEDIIEFFPDATFIINKEKKIIAWNRAMEEMTGVPKKEIIGKDHHQGMIPFYGESRPGLMNLVDSNDEELASKYDFFQRKGNVLYSEAFAPALQSGKGAYIWATASPLMDSGGNVRGVIEAVRDITEHRRAEADLRQARDELETKVEQRTQELTAMNEELAAMYQDLYEANKGLHKEIADRKRAENQLEHKNEELGTAYAELKSVQSQLIQQEKLAGIGQLAAGVAHEINNPLGFVLSNFETLQKYIGRLLEMIDAFKDLHQRVLDNKIPSVQPYAEQITALQKQKKLDYILEDLEPIFRETNEGLSRVGSIVKSLRLFSRIDQQSEFAEFDLNEGIKNSLTVARNEVKYVAEVKENLAEVPAFKAIGGLVNQVLLNILLNAAHAIKAKRLDTLGLITISTYADEQFAYCSIEDSGNGIPEEIRKDIFNPFFTTKPVGQGTGLGLSISYDIVVNKHHGEISFTSEVGVGTTFLVKLPLVQPGEEAVSNS